MENSFEDASMEDTGAATSLSLHSMDVSLPSASALRAELSQAISALSFCELASSAQWAAELCHSVPCEPGALIVPPSTHGSSPMKAQLYSALLLAKSYFSAREYIRAAHVFNGMEDAKNNPAALFLSLYASYLAGEKRREEEAMEVADVAEKAKVKNHELKGIEETLSPLYESGSLDGLNLWLYGIALRAMDRRVEAKKVLLQSVHSFPCNWSAWLDIIALMAADVGDGAGADGFEDMDLPKHWMSFFFRAAFFSELQKNEKARNLYGELARSFPESSYILSQIATCYYNMRRFDESQLMFNEVRRRDPYKLSTLDTYSNILYVKEQSAQLSDLARSAVKIDKYTPEACSIIGNYYSLKGEHEKSVTYFQRALHLNHNFTPAWILMGHEFMEMKNTPAAIDAYRTAVSVNQRDYRAWYGLGQTYELLNLHFYALFYYRRAMTLRPDDARMWCAMGQCYDAMDRKGEALKCFEKAHRCGDRERMALPRLARLHQDMGNRRQAAAYYDQILQQQGLDPHRLQRLALGGGLSKEAVEALRFMMLFYKHEGSLEECKVCAHRLLDTAGPEKDEAKTILRELRSGAEAPIGQTLFEPNIGASLGRRYNPTSLWAADQL